MLRRLRGFNSDIAHPDAPTQGALRTTLHSGLISKYRVFLFIRSLPVAKMASEVRLRIDELSTLARVKYKRRRARNNTNGSQQ
jgi:hypothetical protein